MDFALELDDTWEKVLSRCEGGEEERGMEEGESSCSKGVETYLLCRLKWCQASRLWQEFLLVCAQDEAGWL